MTFNAPRRYSSYEVAILRHPYLAAIPFIALSIFILHFMPRYAIIGYASIAVAVIAPVYYYFEYKEAVALEERQAMYNRKPVQQSQNPEHGKIPAVHDHQEARVIQETKPEPVINARKPPIPVDIDLSDKTKTSITITYGVKKYLDKNKLENETFSDELARLLFNR
jgi:hypothetical protein